MVANRWKKTKVQFLLQNSESGVYYARLFRGGKEVWKSLKTDVYSVAQEKLAAFLQDLRGSTPVVKTIEKGTATVEDLSELYLDQVVS